MKFPSLLVLGFIVCVNLLHAQDLRGLVTNKTHSIYQECSSGKVSEQNGVFTYILTKNQGVRCETSMHSLLKRDTLFSFKFQFKVESNYEYSRYWHSLLQIHSFPDKGENWRCPVLSLETEYGRLKMYSRWDFERISTPVNCAGDDTTMQEISFFEDVDYKVGEWNNFQLSGSFSYENHVCLKVTINDFTKRLCGYNTFNDVKNPYIKLGIYKPTPWDHDDRILVSYKNAVFEYLQ